MLPFSRRTELEREPNELSRELARRAELGKDCCDLTASNPTTAGVPYSATEILSALAAPEAMLYEPLAFGPLMAREAVAHEWKQAGFEVSSERILLTASTSEAYSFLFKLLCDPGDEVLVPSPSYPLFEHLSRFEGVRAVPYALDFDGAWFIDVARVRAAITTRTRAILVVSPNNPTGNRLKRDELSALGALGLPLICDEVFGSYVLSPSERAARSALECEETLVFVLSGLSKLALLPQMKLAWTTLGGPEAWVREAAARLELVADAYLSPSAPVLRALPELLRLRSRSEHHVLTRLRRNQRSLVSALDGSVATVLPVEGGWYAVVRLPGTETEESWVLRLLREADVLVQPGYFFDFTQEPFIVVSLLTPEAEFDTGLARLVEHLRKG